MLISKQMINRSILTNIHRFNVISTLNSFSTITKPSTSKPDFLLWPREREGNIYMDNWSLVNDGLTPNANAYRNARVELINTFLPKKVTANKIELDNIVYKGIPFKLLEAGDNISHDSFNEIFGKYNEYFGAKNIYIEDAAVIAHYASRIGVRVVTDNPATALIARSLLVRLIIYFSPFSIFNSSFLWMQIPIPPREVIPIARFDGWRFDERNSADLNYAEGKWNGESYDVYETPQYGGIGQRPIVAYVGGPGDDVAVQFVETNGKIVGSCVCVFVVKSYYA